MVQKKKGITPQSAKAKGRRLQQKVAATMLRLAPSLHPDDVQSRSMGAGGEDIMLSKAARQVYPISIECKAKAKFAGYSLMDQAKANCPKGSEPVVVVQADRRSPLVLVDYEHYLDLLALTNKLEKGMKT